MNFAGGRINNPENQSRNTTKRVDRPLLAIAFYVGNLVVMLLISSLVKLLAEKYPVSQILFFRYAFAVIPLFFYMTMSHGIASMKSSRPGDHAIRTLSGILGLGLFFFSISTIPLAEATILAYASPIFITVLSIPILAERIGIRRWFAVAIGFIGAAIIVQPGSVVFGLGSMAAIGSALASAFVVIWLRRMSDTENATTTSIIYNASGMAVFGVWLLIYGWVNVTSMLDLILLISVGLCASFQQFFFAVAFRYGEASFLAPFEYLVLVLAAVTGIVFWNEIPPVTTMIGGLIIVGSGLFIFSRSKAKSIKESSLN